MTFLINKLVTCLTFEKYYQEQGMLLVSAFIQMFFVLCYEYCFVPYDMYDVYWNKNDKLALKWVPALIYKVADSS